MEYKKALELKNLLIKDFEKNEKELTAYISKANTEFDNDWFVVVIEKRPIRGEVAIQSSKETVMPLECTVKKIKGNQWCAQDCQDRDTCTISSK